MWVDTFSIIAQHQRVMCAIDAKYRIMQRAFMLSLKWDSQPMFVWNSPSRNKSNNHWWWFPWTGSAWAFVSYFIAFVHQTCVLCIGNEQIVQHPFDETNLLWVILKVIRRSVWLVLNLVNDTFLSRNSSESLMRGNHAVLTDYHTVHWHVCERSSSSHVYRNIMRVFWDDSPCQSENDLVLNIRSCSFVGFTSRRRWWLMMTFEHHSRPV